MQTIHHTVNVTLPTLRLLDASVKHLWAIASPSSILLTRVSLAQLELRSDLPSGPIINHAIAPSDPWILLHLDTLFAQSSILQSKELKMLEWADTPEQVHIAKARLSLYDPMQGEEHKDAKQLRPDPQLLKLFLRSKDYLVCTGAFKWSLDLVPISGRSAGVFIPGTMGYEWIEHLIQVFCGVCLDDRARSWELLAAHLVPKWTMLPSSWCNHFALAFMSSDVHPPSAHPRPAYQCLAEALKDPGNDWKIDQLQSFLWFLLTILAPITLSLSDQLASLENWQAQLPDIPEKKHVQAQVRAIRIGRDQGS